jgi:hypothetical protein
MSLDRDAWIAEARAVSITRPLERIRTRLVARSGELVGPCPVCGGDDRFAVNPRKGLFQCRRSGEGGDVIALTRYLEACDFHTACAILTGQPLPGQGPGDGPAETAEARAARQAPLARRAESLARFTEAARRTEARFREREREQCWALWRAAVPLAGTAAEAYLARRGLVAPAGAPLRCLPDHPLYTDGRAGAAIVHRGPALVAPIVGPSRRFAGLHATWIDLGTPDGKARVSDPGTGEILPARKVRGSARGGRIPLVSLDDPETLVLGEGIETVLSVWLAHAACGWAHRARAAYWAAYSLDNIGGPAAGTVAHATARVRDRRGRERPQQIKGPVPDLARPGLVLPGTVRRVLLLGDGDSDRFTTATALTRAAARFRAAAPDLAVAIAWAPDGQDFNDVLRSVAA